MNKLAKFLLGALMLVVGVAANAIPITVQNASFESPDTTTFIGVVDDWVISGTAGVFDPSCCGDQGSVFEAGVVGDQTAYSNGGDLSQTLSAQLMADTIYSLTVAVGDRSDTTLQSHTIQLLAGNTLIASASDFGTESTTTGSWTDGTATSVAYAVGDSLIGMDLRIALLNNGSTQVNWDNVRLDASVIPAPATLVLLGLGMAILGWKRRA